MGKGGSWERDTCKFLSKWIQGSEKPYVFWRGRGSGAMFTTTRGVGESFAGDIYPVRDEGKFLTDIFVIECKNGYATTSLDKHLKYNKDDNLRNFWMQVLNDSQKTGKLPILVYKKKGLPTPWIGINKKTKDILNDVLLGLRFVHLNWAEPLDDLYLYEMKEFFDTISPEMTKRLFNEN